MGHGAEHTFVRWQCEMEFAGPNGATALYMCTRLCQEGLLAARDVAGEPQSARMRVRQAEQWC